MAAFAVGVPMSATVDAYILALTCVIAPPDVGAFVPSPIRYLAEVVPASADVAAVAVEPSKAFASFNQFVSGSVGPASDTSK